MISDRLAFLRLVRVFQTHHYSDSKADSPDAVRGSPAVRCQYHQNGQGTAYETRDDRYVGGASHEETSTFSEAAHPLDSDLLPSGDLDSLELRYSRWSVFYCFHG